MDLLGAGGLARVRPVADSPLTAVPLSAFDDDREEPVSSYVEAVSYKDNGGGPGAEDEGADRKVETRPRGAKLHR